MIVYHVVEPVTCSIDGVEQVCSLDQTSTPDSRWTLVLTAPDGTTWTGAGQGLWTAFVELRRQLEPLGHRMSCAGARIDAYMRRGRSYDGYLVDLWTRRTFFGIRHQASLFDYAPANLLTTVDEQLARYQFVQPSGGHVAWDRGGSRDRAGHPGSLGRGVWLGQEDDNRRHHCHQPFPDPPG